MHITAIDNALMDILVQVDDAFLATSNLEKGVGNFFSEADLDTIQAALTEMKVAPGGCGANTMSLMALLGSETTFLGKVGNDEFGKHYDEAMKKSGVESNIIFGEGHTGRAITFITPDAQRTFALNLGTANTFTQADLPETIEFLYLSNFILTDPQTQPAVLEAVKKAQKVGLDLSDPNVVTANKEFLESFIKEHVDILLANELEAEAYTGKQPEAAVHELAELAEVAIVKIGKEGSLIGHQGSVIHVPALVVEAIDSTGAGDAYAAGFLHSYLKGESLEKAGALGAFVAAEVVQQIGARLDSLPEV
ncbi:MAG: adenosine kinase [Candidatus Woesearchaeota archaeon]|nr:adenosine kinase [Candidatus Woesearchaeota archaeon]